LLKHNVTFITGVKNYHAWVAAPIEVNKCDINNKIVDAVFTIMPAESKRRLRER
jgi:hypothetical protein